MMLETTQEIYRGKLYFPANIENQIYMLRAGCLIIRDKNGHCYGIKEKNITEKGKTTLIGFCGGICEKIDDNIYMTIMREFYEECILEDNFNDIKTHQSKWLEIIKTSLDNPQSKIEKILNYIYNNLIYKGSLSYVFGSDKLKAYYLQCELKDRDIKYLISNHNLVRIPLLSIFKFTNSKKYKNCRNSPVITLGTTPYYFRNREYSLMSSNFVNYLKNEKFSVSHKPAVLQDEIKT